MLIFGFAEIRGCRLYVPQLIFPRNVGWCRLQPSTRAQASSLFGLIKIRLEIWRLDPITDPSVEGAFSYQHDTDLNKRYLMRALTITGFFLVFQMLSHFILLHKLFSVF